ASLLSCHTACVLPRRPPGGAGPGCARGPPPGPGGPKGNRPPANTPARLLALYGIAPATIRVGSKTPKGYQRTDFADVFERYLVPDGQEEASKPQHRNNADEMGTSTTSAIATAAPLLRFEKAKKSNNDGQCCGVAVANPREAQRAHLETRCDQCGQPALASCA